MAKHKTKQELLKEIAETNRKVIQRELKPRQGKRLIEMARRRLKAFDEGDITWNRLKSL